MRLDEFLRQPEHRNGMRHVIITHGEHIMGVVRINAGQRSNIADLETGVTFGDVAQHDFTIARENDVAFDVIIRLWRRGGAMALVVPQGQSGFHVPRPSDVIGVITNDQSYPR